MGGVVGALAGKGANTSRTDLEDEQERLSGVMAEVTAANPPCKVCSWCVSLQPGTHGVYHPRIESCGGKGGGVVWRKERRGRG